MSESDKEAPISKPSRSGGGKFGNAARETMQAAFVAEYVANGWQATKAAIAAGYAEKGAHVQASRMLKLPKIQEMLARYIRRQLKQTDKLALETLELIKEGAKSDLSDVAEWSDSGTTIRDSKTLPKSVTRNIKSIRITRSTDATGKTSVTYDVTMHGKDKDKEMLAKFTGLVASETPNSDPAQPAGSESSADRSERLLQIAARLKKSKSVVKKAKAE